MERDIFDVIKQRRSVRTFDGAPLSEDVAGKIAEYASHVTNPYGINIEFRTFREMSSAVIVGAPLWIGGKVKISLHAGEAYGFSFEKILLFAESLGVSNVWLAGTFDRKGANELFGVTEGECVPAVSPLGYKAEKMSVRERVMRKGAGSDGRLPFGELFFDFSGRPLEKEKLGGIAEAFEAVRLAPSAVNRQPWRIAFDGKRAHFFSAASRMMNGVDLHLIDLGIALCHFSSALDALGVSHSFSFDWPDVPLAGAVFCATAELL